jgi:hypothetical protein
LKGRGVKPRRKDRLKVAVLQSAEKLKIRIRASLYELVEKLQIACTAVEERPFRAA